MYRSSNSSSVEWRSISVSPRVEAELDDRRRLRRRRGRKTSRPPSILIDGDRSSSTGDDPLELAALRISSSRPVDRGARHEAGDAPVPEKSEASRGRTPTAESRARPLRASARSPRRRARHRDWTTRCGPRRRRIRRGPTRAERSTPFRAGHASRVRDRTVGLEVADAEVRALERHVRVVPSEPRKQASFGLGRGAA